MPSRASSFLPTTKMIFISAEHSHDPLDGVRLAEIVTCEESKTK
jgi:hypothetical protein